LMNAVVKATNVVVERADMQASPSAPSDEGEESA